MIRSMLDVAWAFVWVVIVIAAGHVEEKSFWDEFEDRGWDY